ncbi:MAG: hypothetical protein MR030_07685 [Bacteroidales bacterium]|nr:hypothetical protein [Bacteroidales bacterium]
MSTDKNILDKVNRREGMTVPDGYFDDFASKMMAALPEKPKAPELAPRQRIWLRVRPYAYMAAMFAGIFCMMKMFDMMRSPSADLNIDNYPAVTAAIDNGELDNDIFNGVDENEIMESWYENGYSTEDIYTYEDSIDMMNDTIDQ